MTGLVVGEDVLLLACATSLSGCSGRTPDVKFASDDVTSGPHDGVVYCPQRHL